MKIWDYVTLRCCPRILDCPVTFCSVEENEIRKQVNLIELSFDDVDMIDDEDNIVELTKTNYERET